MADPLSFFPLFEENFQGKPSDVTTPNKTRTQGDNLRYNQGEEGVFALHPLMTPKYAQNKGARDNEFKETLARFYLSLTNETPKYKEKFLDTLPKEDSVRDLAKVLLGVSSAKGGTGFIDFFLQQAQETFNEKMQVEEVLSDNYVAFFFGQQAPIFQYSGTLINSFQDDQRVGMALAYQHLLRGTRCARAGSLLRLRYDSVIVSGTIVSMTQVLNAENELAVPFNFSMLVKEYFIVKSPRAAKPTTKVATPFESGVTLGAVGKLINTRVRVAMIPGQRSSEPVTGHDDGFTTQPGVPAPDDLTQSASTSTENASPTTNIRGSVAVK